MSYMRDSDGNRLDAIAVKALIEGLQDDLDAETTDARNADNLTTGTIPEARIPATIARDAEVTAAIGAAIDGLIGGAPGALDTLAELAQALNDDAAFSATVTAAIAANTSAITTEATTARNASNLSSGLIPDARLAVTIARDARVLRSPGPAVIGQIGASITNNGTLSYYDKTLSGTVSYGSLSPMGFALPKTKGRFCAGGVAATNGYTTAQMISTHLPNVLLSNWDYCVVGEVTNDLGNGVTIATTKANITTIVTALVAAGIVPILTTIPPSDANATGAGLTWITQYNEWIKREARRLRVPVVDYHSVLVSASANTYTASLTSDGTHPVSAGAKVMGDALAEVLNGISGPTRQPLAPSYNPNLMIPDVCATSAGSDKVVGSGNTTGGWAFASATSTKWRGNAPTIIRGSVGDYSIAYPVTGALVAGHRCRLSFGIQAQLTVGSGTWSAYLYNVTQSQVVAGYSAMTNPMDDGTGALATDGAVAATNVVTCATSKPFRPSMVGNPILVLSGVSSRFAAGTTIIGVSADGTQAYLSAATGTTASSQTVVVLGAPQVSAFEFDVQSDMVGDTFNFYLVAGSAAATMISGTQVTLTDLTALGVA